MKRHGLVLNSFATSAAAARTGKVVLDESASDMPGGWRQNASSQTIPGNCFCGTFRSDCGKTRNVIGPRQPELALLRSPLQEEPLVARQPNQRLAKSHIRTTRGHRVGSHDPELRLR